MAKPNGNVFFTSVNKTSITVHPNAREAYLFSKKIGMQYNLDILTPESIKLAQAIHPIIVIADDAQNSMTKYSIISGWIWLDLIERNHINEIQLYEMNLLNADEIKSISWMYLATLELTSFNRKENFNRLQCILAKLDQSKIGKTLLTQANKITSKDMEHLSGENRSVIRGQKKKYPDITSPIEDYVAKSMSVKNDF